MLDYSLDQVRGYLVAHQRLQGRRRVQDMDATRLAVNADEDTYDEASEQLLDFGGERQAKRQAHERAGMERAFSLPAGWDEDA